MTSNTTRAAQVYEALTAWEADSADRGIDGFLTHVVRATTGRDLAPFLDRRVRHAEEHLVAFVGAALEQCHVAREWLRPGDLVAWTQGRGTGIGIVVSNKHLATPCRGQLTWVAMDYAQYGWRLETPIEKRDVEDM